MPSVAHVTQVCHHGIRRCPWKVNHWNWRALSRNNLLKEAPFSPPHSENKTSLVHSIQASNEQLKSNPQHDSDPAYNALLANCIWESVLSQYLTLYSFFFPICILWILCNIDLNTNCKMSMDFGKNTQMFYGFVQNYSVLLIYCIEHQSQCYSRLLHCSISYYHGTQEFSVFFFLFWSHTNTKHRDKCFHALENCISKAFDVFISDSTAYSMLFIYNTCMNMI